METLVIVIKQLIRTALVAEDGHRFIVADFSAIEARVIAWLAHEQWRQDVFAQGGDIYCASASSMFHVPVEKHGVNGHLRQKGKVAELALGYGGGVGAMKAMDTKGEIPEKRTPWNHRSMATSESANYEILERCRQRSKASS